MKKIGKTGRTNTALILLHVLPVPFRLVFGYSLTLIGFTIILFGKEIRNKLQHNE